jgi:hypothetical protein
MMHNNYPYPPMMHIRGSMPPPPQVEKQRALKLLNRATKFEEF